MSETKSTFETLEVWIKGRDLRNNVFINYKSDINEVIKLLNGYIKYLKGRIV